MNPADCAVWVSLVPATDCAQYSLGLYAPVSLFRVTAGALDFLPEVPVAALPNLDDFLEPQAIWILHAEAKLEAPTAVCTRRAVQLAVSVGNVSRGTGTDHSMVVQMHQSGMANLWPDNTGGPADWVHLADGPDGSYWMHTSLLQELCLEVPTPLRPVIIRRPPFHTCMHQSNGFADHGPAVIRCRSETGIPSILPQTICQLLSICHICFLHQSYSISSRRRWNSISERRQPPRPRFACIQRSTRF